MSDNEANKKADASSSDGNDAKAIASSGEGLSDGHEEETQSDGHDTEQEEESLEPLYSMSWPIRAIPFLYQ